MNADDMIENLFRLLEEWRLLTCEETDSIRRDDWQNIDRIQARKDQLQETIQQAERALFGGEALGSERREAVKARVRGKAEELKCLETENRDLLMKRLWELDDRLASSNRTLSGLRSVKKAYSIAPRSFWQALS